MADVPAGAGVLVRPVDVENVQETTQHECRTTKAREDDDHPSPDAQGTAATDQHQHECQRDEHPCILGRWNGNVGNQVCQCITDQCSLSIEGPGPFDAIVRLIDRSFVRVIISLETLAI